MHSLFSFSRGDDDGAHCYSSPPQCQGEVFDPLRLSESCGIEMSFSAALHVDMGRACKDDGS